MPSCQAQPALLPDAEAPRQCCALCAAFAGCKTWTWYDHDYKGKKTPCYFKEGCKRPKAMAGCTSGGEVEPLR
eukprot:gene8259-3968_t